jgi:D-tyrosyl-tRNA(Tyr) deacylase
MRALLQRVKEASVEVKGEITGRCGSGLLILVAVAPGDTQQESAWLARKIAHLRIFPDEQNHMNRSIVDVSGSALVVSQFTLYGDCRKGRRPSFVGSAGADVAEPLYEVFCEDLALEGIPTERGIFAAEMAVSLVNDGPVTLMIDTPDPSS